jgi:MEMO1 family protein
MKGVTSASAQVRPPAVAGRFYPGAAAELAAEVARYLGSPAPTPGVVGAVAPHAGYVYSGACAGKTFRRLEVPRQVVVLAPNHTGRGVPISVSDAAAFRLPGGDVPVDASLRAAILDGIPGARLDARAHQHEHAVEVELPFLRARRPDVAVVPVVLGGLSGEEAVALGEALARVLATFHAEVLVLASSDMCHYLPDDVTRQRDRLAIDRLLALDALGLYRTCEEHDISMCGVLPATAMLACARARGANAAELCCYATSGDAFGDRDRVVGYAGVIVTRDERA